MQCNQTSTRTCIFVATLTDQGNAGAGPYAGGASLRPGMPFVLDILCAIPFDLTSRTLWNFRTTCPQKNVRKKKRTEIEKREEESSGKHKLDMQAPDARRPKRAKRDPRASFVRYCFAARPGISGLCARRRKLRGAGTTGRRLSGRARINRVRGGAALVPAGRASDRSGAQPARLRDCGDSRSLAGLRAKDQRL